LPCITLRAHLGKLGAQLSDQGIRPFVYLYGTKNGTLWRAKLSLVHFAQHGASIFLDWMP
jgi:hypothetical protein